MQTLIVIRYDESCSGEVNYNEFVEKLMESDFHGGAHTGHRANLTRMASSAFGMHSGDDEFAAADEDSDFDEEERETFRRTEIKLLFDQIDFDHSGAIDKREMKILLAKLGLDPDEDSINEGFKKIDKDDSDKIEFDEFYDWYKSVCFHKKLGENF